MTGNSPSPSHTTALPIYHNINQGSSAQDDPGPAGLFPAGQTGHVHPRLVRKHVRQEFTLDIYISIPHGYTSTYTCDKGQNKDFSVNINKIITVTVLNKIYSFLIEQH